MDSTYEIYMEIIDTLITQTESGVLPWRKSSISGFTLKSSKDIKKPISTFLQKAQNAYILTIKSIATQTVEAQIDTNLLDEAVKNDFVEKLAHLWVIIGAYLVKMHNQNLKNLVDIFKEIGKDTQ